MTDQLHLIDAPEWGPAAVDLLAGSRDVECGPSGAHVRGVHGGGQACLLPRLEAADDVRDA